MHTWFKNTLTLLTAILFLVIFWSSNAMRSGIEMPFDLNERELTESDTPDVEPVDLPYPHKDKSNEGDPLYDNNNSGMFLKDPSNIKTDVTYNPKTGNYDITQKMGDMNYRPANYMTLDEYKRYDMEQSMKKYWKSKSDAENFNKSKPLIPKLNVGGEMFDRIFGGNTVDIRPQGTAELIFAVNTARNSNPAIPQKQRKVSTFDFNQKIQLNVIGKIGDKLKLTTSYNTEATFDFENQMKLEYTGYDDEIIQKIEAGNVSLPLTGSLITGSQSLFGIKTALKFGKLNVTSVFSQSKGQKKEVTIPPGGGQLNYFTINGDNYEANKHYFLSQYFRDHYDKALEKLPFVNSGVNITRVEVWVTNRTYDINNRNVAGFMDIGELNPYNNGFIYPTAGATAPDNKSNTLYDKIKLPSNADARDFNKITSSSGFGKYISSNFTLGKDFDITVAKKMQPSDFTFNAKLGYISINQPLNNDEVLAVAYQYTLDGKTYQVGEFSTDGVDAPKVLFLKLLKASLTNVRLPTWDLMMKNVYALGAFQIQKEDFKLDIVHNDIKKGIDFNYLPEGTGVKATPLVRVLGLDKLNRNSDPQPDGIFDIVEGVTINLEKGRVFFPSIEPFGSYLQNKFPSDEQEIAKKYVFQALYDSTKFAAQQLPALNRYKIKGSYKSSSGSDISLNALNIPQGSVTVTAGGVLLVENVDYTVDYSLGRVKIINDGILNSGNAIKASYESNSMFSIQQKSLMGTHLDYKVNKDFALGATAIHVNERPLTQKVNLGDEPISNTIWGLDGSYRTELPWLTKAIDFLPMLSTKEKSTLSVTGEFAQLLPGHSKAVTKEGQSYIDDFEGSQSTIDIKNQSSWVMASIPKGQPDLFPEATRDSVYSGYHRAKFGWYIIDPLFWRDNNLTPTHIKGTAQQSNNFVREIREQEIFPNRSLQAGQQLTNLPVLDLAFYPKEKGPYNFNPSEIDGFGHLTNTNASWGGMMRRLETTDFENSNIQYVQFWMMDPFNADYDSAFHTSKPTRGELYINLGDVSEDILPDNRMSFENGLPTTSTITGVDTTSWGRVPTNQVVVNAFDNNTSSREFQDVGFDGLSDADELAFFHNYIGSILNGPGGQSAQDLAKQDPSSDNYHFFRGDDYDNAKLEILARYKQYNNQQGNSAVASDPYPTQSTTLPNVEDINKDNTLNRNEAYYQYKIKLDPNNMTVGQNYITNKVSGSGTLKNGQTISCDWYQFKVPVRSPDRVVGNIQDYRSLRFIRIFMKGFDKPVVCRMAKLEFLRGEWRAYSNTKFQPGEYLSNDNFNETPFNIGAVNYEENSSRKPINYVLPPGIRRQQQANSPTLVQLNEQSLSLSVCNLEDGDERAAFKNTEYDMRLYKKLKMFVHAENKSEAELKKGDLVGYIRLGTDFDQNYYEYEYPLKATAWGATTDTDIWPEENNVEIHFTDLQDAKLARNNAYHDATGSGNQTPYVIKSTFDQNGVSVTRKITVVGNPNLAAVKVIMVGIRNPKKASVTDADDGLPKCAEVWVNELRLTDFDDKSGWAALTRTQVKLADFGNLTAAGNVSTPGFGTVDQKLNERQKEQILKYDLAGSFEMGKFLPMNWNIKIPMYVGWSQQFITPRFNPLEPDIEYKKSLKALDTDSARQATKTRTLDVTNRKSINFTNVKKEKGSKGGKNHIYDVENLAFTYAFTESFHHDYNVEYLTFKTYKGSVNYGFNSSPKNFKPFSKIIKSKSEYFKIVKDFNFTLLPNRIGARADLDRQYTETQNRDNTGEGQIITPTFNKSFTMLRSYDYGHDLAKALKFTFNASNNSRIDEPTGRYHKLTNKERDTLSQAAIDTADARYDLYNKTLWNNFKKTMGRTTNYHQTASLDYTIPINKIPMFNWVTASAKYTSNFDWNVASLGLDTIGNTIQNSNTKQYNTTLNTVTLFNKIPYFKKITSPPKPVPKQSEITKKIATYNDSIKKLDKGILVHEKAITKLKKKKKTDDIKLTQDSIKKKTKTIKLLNHRIDSLNKELEKNKPNVLLATITKAILSVKNVSGSYSENNGTLLPGYLPRTQLFGQSPDWSSPGAGFVFGQQDTNFARHAGEQGWLTKSTSLNNSFAMTNSKNTNLRATVEPFKDLKIDLTATKTEAFNKSEFYRWNNEVDTFSVQSPLSTGNYSVSFISIKTAFKKDKPSNDPHPYESETFLKFLNSRSDFSKRIGGKNPNSTENDSGYYQGYGATSQDVLIPAFLAAYSGKSSLTAATTAFPSIPLPNWRVTYDGLTKLQKFKKYFKNFSLSHGYRSTYSVSSYTSNLLYYGDSNGNPTAFDQNGNYQAKNIISAISISEQFAPLISADATWNNSLITKFELKRDRNLNMNFANIQLTEIRGNEISVGTGYRFKNVTIPLTIGGKKTTLKSDLDLRSDVSVRQSKTIIRKASDQSNQLTAGQNVITLKNSANYVVNERLNVRLFYDRVINSPYVSTSFKTSNTNAGISIRFTLAN